MVVNTTEQTQMDPAQSLRRVLQAVGAPLKAPLEDTRKSSEEAEALPIQQGK
jgi:hypothetical protein